MQTRQNVEKIAKCGDFFSGARGNAKLMINFFLPYTDFYHFRDQDIQEIHASGSFLEHDVHGFLE